MMVLEFLLVEWTVAKKAFIVKLGCELYNANVQKNEVNAFVDFYKVLSEDRTSFSKYDAAAELFSVSVQPDAMLTKEFFENIEEISKAQDIVRRYSNVLKL